VGHKHYWRSDISVHRRPDWYASVKMSSTRVIGAETCNSENMLGLHLGDGVTYFYRTGREYENIFPVWDWNRLPGTTCRQGDGSLVPESKRCRGRSDFVGGVSDSRRGLAAMEYVRDGLSARKVWFFLDDAVVCMGAGISCNQPEPVLTSVNQCLLKGSVALSADQHKRTLIKGERRSDKIEWVHHDGMGYVFLGPTSLTVGAAEQHGNWHRVHHRESKKAVRRDVFSLGIDHGARPQGAQYAYAVFPDIRVEALQSLHASELFRILQQTASLQAISTDDGDRVQAAFFEPGRLIMDKDRAVQVDAPCLVMLERSETSIHLHVADPTHRRETIHVTVSGNCAATGATYDSSSGQTRFAVAMPQGGRAGQTVSVRAAEAGP
jgi:chondroitin AC lyase